ncbi:DUF998 domain-containing protein [Micromonospora sp. LAH09]|uniref:DUF998 domain-containing protein n=1 Tax=Micromonospora cabrerizensis TaxID=2911213 RepID=UPI001EE82F79|nr:DUF998 domain-containing protein [Micromonospora cabrerizensis]MCG5472400.1 DUF998 domain-containing protein [Micromonospora cabrerizensis]
MSAVPRWALLSAGGAPVFLIGGWTLAQAAQPDGFDPIRQTISALAATDADQRWIMTVALAGLGLCHLATALGLVAAAPAARGLLALGGLATLVLVAFPQRPGGGSTTHAVAAGVAFVALAVWPALAVPRRAAPSHEQVQRDLPDGSAPRVRGTALAVTAVLLGLLGWFAVELFTDGARIGLSERLVAAAEAVVPLAAVLAALASERRPGASAPR